VTPCPCLLRCLGQQTWDLPVGEADPRPVGGDRGGGMKRLVGIDLAVTAESRACVTDETGK